MRIGVLGGTFDPIHVGHLVAGEEVRYALGLEKVLFVPAGEPPHREARGVSPTVHRVRMVERAIASNPFFELSLVDVNRPGKSYTVDTLRVLKEQFGPAAELFFIIGMDSLAELVTWKDPARILELCRLAVVNRPPYREVDLLLLERQLPGVSRRVETVEMPGITIAASDLRARVARGKPIKYQVTEPVEEYIHEHRLYRAST